MRVKKLFRLTCVLAMVVLFMVCATCGSALGISTIPADGDEDVPVDDPLIIQFDDQIDRASVNVSVEPDPGFTFRREWSNMDSKLKLIPTESLSNEKKYKNPQGI